MTTPAPASRSEGHADNGVALVFPAHVAGRFDAFAIDPANLPGHLAQPFAPRR